MAERESQCWMGMEFAKRCTRWIPMTDDGKAAHEGAPSGNPLPSQVHNPRKNSACQSGQFAGFPSTPTCHIHFADPSGLAGVVSTLWAVACVSWQTGSRLFVSDGVVAFALIGRHRRLFGHLTRNFSKVHNAPRGWLSGDRQVRQGCFPSHHQLKRISKRPAVVVVSASSSLAISSPGEFAKHIGGLVILFRVCPAPTTAGGDTLSWTAESLPNPEKDEDQERLDAWRFRQVRGLGWSRPLLVESQSPPRKVPGGLPCQVSRCEWFGRERQGSFTLSHSLIHLALMLQHTPARQGGFHFTAAGAIMGDREDEVGSAVPTRTRGGWQ